MKSQSGKEFLDLYQLTAFLLSERLLIPAKENIKKTLLLPLIRVIIFLFLPIVRQITSKNKQIIYGWSYLGGYAFSGSGEIPPKGRIQESNPDDTVSQELRQKENGEGFFP
jgi:hypothetical protein